MRTQQSKADHAWKRTMSRITLRLAYFPVVAFTVSCKPARIRSADTYRESGKISRNGTYRLAANVRPNTSAVPGNAPAPGQP
jgi:hypothetical protein